MLKEYIDVDYEVIPSNDHKNDTNITINADPVATAISGITSITNHLMDSVKEYKMCEQQEKTKREAIKAQMKAEIERIHAQKDLCMKVLEEQHQENMRIIEENYEQSKQAMKTMSRVIQSASKVMEQSGDASGVCMLLKSYCEVLETISNIELKRMHERNRHIEMQNPVSGLLK